MSRSLRLLLPIAIAVLASLGHARAHAEIASEGTEGPSSSTSSAGRSSADTTDSADQEARSVFEAGRTAFSHGRYEQALQFFRQAHELSGRPQLLYNIAQALDRLDRDEEALEAYRRFAAEDPESDLRAQVDARIAIIEAHLEAEAAEAEAHESTPPIAAPSPSFDPLPSVVLFASAGVALVTGVTLGALALEHDGRLSAMCTGMSCDDSLRGLATEMDALALGADIALGASLALATTAVIVLVVSAPSAESPRALVCGPAGCGPRF
ncbi:MAG: tetratricopeptide repeat protein [Sandaracinaceae bacterium]|nr:tetratricopeptide repeat protein [Sandaracinaceae bacterium]